MSGHSFSLKLTEDQWTLAADALQFGADDNADEDWSRRCSDLATLLRNKIDTVMIAATGSAVYGNCEVPGHTACDTITRASQ